MSESSKFRYFCANAQVYPAQSQGVVVVMPDAEGKAMMSVATEYNEDQMEVSVLSRTEALRLASSLICAVGLDPEVATLPSREEIAGIVRDRYLIEVGC